MPVVARPPRRPRRSVGVAGVDLADRVVELADAGEARRERDVGVGQVGRLDQHPCGLRPLRPGQRQRPGAELGGEQPGEVARGVADVRGQPVDALAVDDAVGDQPHRAAGGVGGDVPVGAARRGVGQAALAGAVAGGLGGGRARVERDVGERRRARRARGPAVDAGGPDRGVEDAVEPPVARLHRAVAGLGVQLSRSGLMGSIMTQATDTFWRESDTHHVRRRATPAADACGSTTRLRICERGRRAAAAGRAGAGETADGEARPPYRPARHRDHPGRRRDRHGGDRGAGLPATWTATSRAARSRRSTARTRRCRSSGRWSPMNILVLGSDSRDGPGNGIDDQTGIGGRSDTTILLHVSADRKTGVRRQRSRGTRWSTARTARPRTVTRSRASSWRCSTRRSRWAAWLAPSRPSRR